MLSVVAINDQKIVSRTAAFRGVFVKNKRVGLSALCGCIFLLQGCLSQDTTGDTTQHEINRQNAVASQIEKQYRQVKGQYAGMFHYSKLLLTLDVVRLNSTGNGDLGLVPLPHLIGSLEVFPTVLVNDEKSAIGIPYPVVDGQYVNGNDLSLVVQVNGAPTNLHCNVSEGQPLECDWYMNASSAARASFSLSQVSAQDEQLHGNQSADGLKGLYVGKNKDYTKIIADFRMILSPQVGSVSVPMVSVAGNFTFYTSEMGSANFPIVDSEFDPISSTLAIKINGDNPIVVDCSIVSEISLHCVWNGRHGPSSFEEFDLTKSESL